MRYSQKKDLYHLLLAIISILLIMGFAIYYMAIYRDIALDQKKTRELEKQRLQLEIENLKKEMYRNEE
jgi:hypothetical protein